MLHIHQNQPNWIWNEPFVSALWFVSTALFCFGRQWQERYVTGWEGYAHGRLCGLSPIEQHLTFALPCFDRTKVAPALWQFIRSQLKSGDKISRAWCWWYLTLLIVSPYCLPMDLTLIYQHGYIFNNQYLQMKDIRETDRCRDGEITDVRETDRCRDGKITKPPWAMWQ